VAYAVAALAIVALSLAAALLVSWAKQETLRRLQATAPAVKRWGGVVLVVVGAWFIALGVFAYSFARLFPVSPPS
jgi:hypothetical protein